MKLFAGENADLAEHLKKCEEVEKSGGRNQLTFLSHNFVKKSLNIIRQYLVQSIVNTINRCDGQFGLMIDGSQDISCKEQISVVVRYVSDTNDVVERTILFLHAKSTTGRALYELLVQQLDKIKLPIRNAVGCSFDGAPNMRSDIKGVISFIRENDNSDCLYTWCLSHRNNLAMKAALSGSLRIGTILNLAEESAKLFRSSYVKMNVWTEVATAVPNFNSRRKLKLIGTTRWTSKQHAIDSIISHEVNLFVLIKALLKICSLNNLDGPSLLNASNILNSWLQYGNIVTTFVLHKVFSAVTPTTKYLQSSGLNILDGVKSLRECKQKLQAVATQLDDYLEQAEKFSVKVNDLIRSDKEITNLDCDCAVRLPVGEEKEKENQRIKNDFFDFIQKLLRQIDEHILLEFDEQNGIYSEIQFLDPLYAEKKLTLDENSLRIDLLCGFNQLSIDDTTCELREFVPEFIAFVNRPQYVSMLNDDHDEYYYDHFACEERGSAAENDSDPEESNVSLKSIKVQNLRERECYCVECILKYISSAEDRKKLYGNILKLYRYIATLPSTQVKCERDFSKLKLTKTRLRSCLSDETLEDLLIISVESGMFHDVDLENLIDQIVETSSRLSLYMSL